MKPLSWLLDQGKTLRVMGFDDAPFAKARGTPVQVAGVVCADTRFEGMVWGQITQDGTDATECLSELVLDSKFYPQLNLILLDGLALGGFNLVDLPTLAQTLQRPCVAVMRKLPDMPAVFKALEHFSDQARRRTLIAKAGQIWEYPPFYFQVQGEAPEPIARALAQLTDQGHVPEALRLAHLIGSAVMAGQSSKRA